MMSGPVVWGRSTDSLSSGDDIVPLSEPHTPPRSGPPTIALRLNIATPCSLLGGAKEKKKFCLCDASDTEHASVLHCDAESIKGIEDHGLTDMSELGDLPDRQVLFGVQPFQTFPAPQTGETEEG